MSRIVGILILVVSLMAGIGTHAQSKTVPVAKPKKVLIPQAYLGNSEYKGGPIPKDVLAGLLKQGVTARDSAGNRYKVTGFEFVYGERQLYEDSLSNLMVVVDYLSEYCPGDTLSAGISSSIYDRLKAGDTAYFNSIDVLRTKPGQQTGDIIMGRGMKFAITK